MRRIIPHSETNPNERKRVDTILSKLKHYKNGERILDCGCFPVGTNIKDQFYNDRTIEEISIGDIILSSSGKKRKVKNTFKRLYDGDFYTIETSNKYMLTATTEHPVLGFKKKDAMCKLPTNKLRTCNTNNYGRCTKCLCKSYDNPKFIPISELEKGDYVAIPRKIGNGIRDVNLHLARLLGWYLAEGSIVYSHKPKIAGAVFTLGITEMKYAEEIKDSALELGITSSIKIKTRRDKNTIEIFCFGKRFGELMLELGNKLSDKKRLHYNVFEWKEEAHQILLQSYFRGDGHHRKLKIKGEQYTVKSTSKKLLEQIRLIFNKYGISPSFGTYITEGKKPAYSLTLSGVDVEFLEPRQTSHSSSKRYRVSKDYIFLPINKVTRKKVSEYVYNFEVEKDHTYIANGICVHNCGDSRVSLEKAIEGCRVYGIDLTPSQIKLANGYKKDYKADYEPIFSVMNAKEIEYPDNYFDVIICSEVLEHLDKHDMLEVVHELKRVGKPSCEMIITVPNANCVKGSEAHPHLQSLTEPHLAKYFRVKESFKIKIDKERSWIGLVAINRPCVSVIIPSYNNGKYILDAINSVKTQRDFYDYEIIVVEDGSTDDTLKRLQGVKGITLLMHNGNKGVVQGWNTGFSYATGDYYIILSSDDMFEENTLRCMFEEIHYSQNTILVYGYIQSVDENGVENAPATQFQEYDYDALIKANYIGGAVMMDAKMFDEKTSIGEQVLYAEPDEVGACDWGLWLKYADYAYNHDKEIVRLHMSLYRYRTHPGQTRFKEKRRRDHATWEGNVQGRARKRKNVPEEEY